MSNVGRLKQQVRDLEQRIAALEATVQPTPVPNAYILESSIPSWQQHHNNGNSASQPGHDHLPWVSKSVRISEQLTSFDFGVKVQLGQALLITLVGILIGAAAVAIFDLVWYAALIIGLCIGALALTYFILDHRGLLHQVVNGGGAQARKKKQLRVTVKHEENKQQMSQYRTLLLNGDIDRDDLRHMAQEVMNGKGLAIHSWIGVGGWSRAKLDNLFAELEKMGYAVPGRGNKARQLTRKGKALFRALAEK